MIILYGFTDVSHMSARRGAEKDRRKIEIAAKPEVVLNLIRDFAKISAWNPAAIDSIGATNPDQGEERVIALMSGGKITDALTDYDASKMTYSYRRVDDDVKIFPVSFYSATISVSPASAGSEVEWIGRFYHGDTSNEPPPNLTDEVATKAMTDFFEAGLNNLKKLAEKKVMIPAPKILAVALVLVIANESLVAFAAGDRVYVTLEKTAEIAADIPRVSSSMHLARPFMALIGLPTRSRSLISIAMLRTGASVLPPARVTLPCSLEREPRLISYGLAELREASGGGTLL